MILFYSFFAIPVYLNKDKTAFGFITTLVVSVGIRVCFSAFFGFVAKRISKSKEKEVLENVFYTNTSVWLTTFFILEILYGN